MIRRPHLKKVALELECAKYRSVSNLTLEIDSKLIVLFRLNHHFENYRKTSNKRRSLIDAGGVECTEINKRRPLIDAGATGQWHSDLDIQVIAL